MDDDILEVVTEWDARSVADGVRGLHELADADFSGAVTDGRAWAFFLNGRVVGVFDGTIEDFDGSLTARVAPDVSLPLLYTMQEGGGETRAQYYTNDTPISTTDETLSAGNFVGYIELSENVLSGDYYVVYYGGRSFPVAFVGNEPQLLTGDEAFERADDEVGIYSVVDADVEVVDLPDRPDDMSAATGTVTGAGTDATDPGSHDARSTATAGAAEATDATGDAGGDVGPAGTRDAETADGGAGSAVVTDEPEGDAGAAAETAGTTATEEDGGASAAGVDADEADDDDGWTEPPSATAGADAASTTESEPESTTDAEPESTTESESASTTDAEPASTSEAATTGSDSVSAAESASTTEAESATGTESEPATETGSEPASTAETESERDASVGTATEPDTDSPAGETGAPPGSESTADADTDPSSADADTKEVAESPASTSRTDAGSPGATEEGDSGGGAATDDRIDRLRRQLEAARAAKDEAEEARRRAESERDEYRAEVERLRERVAELEARLDAADEETETEATRVLSADEALAATNLFVRYDDKTDGTLEHAAQGTISEAELRSNLRLEYHTEFETEGVRVEGQAFDAFLRSTREHRFVRWFLTHVLYQIRGAGTDARSDLSKLYETIERIDRIDFGGDVTVAPEGPGAEADASARFDVVFRNRMGDALFVAAFDDGRDPTAAPTLDSLLERAESVSQTNESFAAAFAVTESFFDAGAMETAVEATRGGLFSRSNRRSYVKLSRKLGFHLCLVEARDDDFFLTMPEL